MKLFEGKLILSDLDGTYLYDDHHISEENRAAVRYFMDNGGLFTVATGRSKAGMEHFFPELEINAPAILYNGSVIYDFERKADVLDTCVEQAGFDLCKTLEATFSDIGIEVYANHTPYVAQDNFWTRRHFQNVKMPWNFCPAEDIPQMNQPRPARPATAGNSITKAIAALILRLPLASPLFFSLTSISTVNAAHTAVTIKKYPQSVTLVARINRPNPPTSSAISKIM